MASHISDSHLTSGGPDLPLPLPGGGAMLFRRIPAGSFWMGSLASGEPDEEPRHRVVFPCDYYLGKFVVTQADWRAVVALSSALKQSPGPEPSDKVNKGDRRPVTDVSWDDATAWCDALTAWLKARPGRWPPNLTGAKWSLRLPTEAEWEYACRAGTDTEYYNGDGEAALDEVGWFGDPGERGAHPVDDTSERHPAGLFGVHGNVWEWCRDVYRDGFRRRIDGDPAVEECLREGESHDRLPRVIRGGSWFNSAAYCRAAYRSGGLPFDRYRYRGFRVCLAPGPAGASQPEQPAGADALQAGAGRERRRPTRPESSAPAPEQPYERKSIRPRNRVSEVSPGNPNPSVNREDRSLDCGDLSSHLTSGLSRRGLSATGLLASRPVGGTRRLLLSGDIDALESGDKSPDEAKRRRVAAVQGLGVAAEGLETLNDSGDDD